MNLCPLEIAFADINSNIKKSYTNSYNNKYNMDAKVLNTVDANTISFNNKFIDTMNYKYVDENNAEEVSQILDKNIVIEKCPYCKKCKSKYIYDKETDLLLIAGMSLLFLTILVGK
jgi:hypothetical protein